MTKLIPRLLVPAIGGFRAARAALKPRSFTAVILAVVVILLFSGVALAHAAFVRSEPAPNSVLSEPPRAITVWFTEDVEPGLSKIIVLDAMGERVSPERANGLPGDPKAMTVPLPSLPNGVYTVGWEAFAIDGHSLTGSFVFSVGVPLATAPVVPATLPNPSQPLTQPVAEVVLRWLGLLSILAITGCLVFEMFITRPVLAASSDSNVSHRMGQQAESRTLKIVCLATGLFLATSIGELVVKAVTTSNAPMFQVFGSPMVSVFQTEWGGLLLWRLNLLLAMIAVLVMASLERGKKYHVDGVRAWQAVTLVFAGGTLFVLCMASHGAAMTEIQTAAIFSDYLHMLAAGVWVGGIFYMALVIPSVMKTRLKEMGGNRVSGCFCPESHVTAIGRFSTLATLSVAVLFITGLYSSWAQVTVFQALATPYGVMLLIKVGLIIPLLLLGAVNLFYIRPRLASDGKALQLLRKTVTAEAILVILVLLAVGVLVSMEPARQTESRKLIDQFGRPVLQNTADGVNVKVILEPGDVGPNLATVFLTDRSGKPIINASLVTLELTYMDSDIGMTMEDIIDHGGGIWVAHQPVLSVAGNWQATFTIKRPDTFDVRTSFKFRVPLLAGGSGISVSAETGRRLWGVELLFLGFLLGGIATTFGRWWARSSAFFFVTGIVLAITGIIVIVAG